MSSQLAQTKIRAQLDTMQLVRHMHALLWGFREEGQPTINAVIALTELLDKWSVLLTHDACSKSLAPDAFDASVGCLRDLLGKLHVRVDTIESDRALFLKGSRAGRN